MYVSEDIMRRGISTDGSGLLVAKLPAAVLMEKPGRPQLSTRTTPRSCQEPNVAFMNVLVGLAGLNLLT